MGTWERSTMLSLWLLLCLSIAACQSQELKPLGTATNLMPNSATFVYINGTKYRLIQRHPNHWLMIDPQSDQPVHLTNQLVVKGPKSVDELRQRLNIMIDIGSNQIAPGVLIFNGTIAALLQLEQQLKSLPDVQTEWQLFYLPLKTQSDR